MSGVNSAPVSCIISSRNCSSKARHVEETSSVGACAEGAGKITVERDDEEKGRVPSVDSSSEPCREGKESNGVCNLVRSSELNTEADRLYEKRKVFNGLRARGGVADARTGSGRT